MGAVRNGKKLFNARKTGDCGRLYDSSSRRTDHSAELHDSESSTSLDKKKLSHTPSLPLSSTAKHKLSEYRSGCEGESPLERGRQFLQRPAVPVCIRSVFLFAVQQIFIEKKCRCSIK